MISEQDFELYLGPQEQGGADSLLEPIIRFIDRAQARQKLMIAVQEIDHPEIAQAIVRARLRKVTIDVVLEQSYLLDVKAAADPFASGGGREINRTLFSAMLRSTTDVKCDFNPKIFHQKFMILGNSVLTGSTNFTTTGVTKNLNHIVIIHDAEVANVYKKEFREIQQGRFGKASINVDDRPKEARVGSIRVKPLFAPDHGPEMEMMKQILKARERIDFAVFTFAQSSGIDDALVSAHRNGIQVTGVLDRKQANQKWAAKHVLVDAGIQIHVVGQSKGLGKLHHKMMTIDDKVSVFGSFNYTGPANKSNDENIIVVGDIDEQNADAKLVQSRIATAARMEVERIAAMAT